MFLINNNISKVQSLKYFTIHRQSLAELSKEVPQKEVNTNIHKKWITNV